MKNTNSACRTTVCNAHPEPLDRRSLRPAGELRRRAAALPLVPDGCVQRVALVKRAASFRNSQTPPAMPISVCRTLIRLQPASPMRPSDTAGPSQQRSYAALEPSRIGFLVDDLRASGRTTYVELAATLNAQGIRPPRGRWTAHDLYLAMRRHRRAHPAATQNAGHSLYQRRADEARRVIRKLRRQGFKTQAMIARAMNARGLTTPGLGRPWSARGVSRVLQENGRRNDRLAVRPAIRLRRG
jgi:hypothetical protein